MNAGVSVNEGLLVIGGNTGVQARPEHFRPSPCLARNVTGFCLCRSPFFSAISGCHLTIVGVEPYRPYEIHHYDCQQDRWYNARKASADQLGTNASHLGRLEMVGLGSHRPTRRAKENTVPSFSADQTHDKLVDKKASFGSSSAATATHCPPEFGFCTKPFPYLLEALALQPAGDGK